MGNPITQEITNGRNKALEQREEERGVSNLPVYKAAANTAYVIAQIVKQGDRKLLRLYDSIISSAFELCILIADASAARTPGARLHYLDKCQSRVDVLKTQSTILVKLGIMPKEQHVRLKRLLKSISSQIGGWSSSLKR